MNGLQLTSKLSKRSMFIAMTPHNQISTSGHFTIKITHINLPIQLNQPPNPLNQPPSDHRFQINTKFY
jgi:hypothetical protein